MLTWIVSTIAAVFNFIPVPIWIIILIAGTILFMLGGEGLFGFFKVFVLLLLFYGFLWIVAALLPTWLENVVILAVIVISWWVWHN